MNHEIVYRAQKGTRQYGVDLVSVGSENDGERKLFLWLIKCGDINRFEWNSGPQAVRQSIEDVGDIYLRSHVAPQHQGLKKKLLVLTNGDFNASLNETIAGYLENWSQKKQVETAQINGSTLASWTEQHLLDEYILPAGNRALLRRMLANVGSPDLCISVGRDLVDSMLAITQGVEKGGSSKKKKFLTALRGIRTALSVLKMWALDEENLLAPYRLAEYSALAVWANFHEEIRGGDKLVSVEYGQLLFHLSEIAELYHRRLEPYYVTQDAFANVLPNSLLVSKNVFQEVGRLGFHGCFWAAHAVRGSVAESTHITKVYADRLEALLLSHSCAQLPAYDHHSADIHIGLLLLVTVNRLDVAREWVRQLCQRLYYSAKAKKFQPMSTSFDEAVLVQYGFAEIDEKSISTSTLLPILLIWTAVLELADGYKFLREQVVPGMPNSTPNFWSPDQGFDTLVANHTGMYEHGVGEGIFDIPERPEEFLAKMSAPLSGIKPIKEMPWYEVGATYIPMLAALYWHTQLPREMLVQQPIALLGMSLSISDTSE